MTKPHTPPAATALPPELLELLEDDNPLSPDQLAHGCCMSLEWVHARVQAGVLPTHSGHGPTDWRFASATLLRARRIAHLEQTFDADPQLAALTTDLIEEVTRLRQWVQQHTQLND